MFNVAGSPTGTCWAVLWVVLGQEEPAVGGERSHYAPCASMLAHAPAMQHVPRALYGPMSGIQQSWEVDSKATETISAVACLVTSRSIALALMVSILSRFAMEMVGLK